MAHGKSRVAPRDPSQLDLVAIAETEGSQMTPTAQRPQRENQSSSMEGKLFQKSWFSEWIPVYLRCANQLFSVYEKEADDRPLYRWPLWELTLTPGQGKNWCRLCVVRLEYSEKHFFFGAANKTEFTQWIHRAS
jgi:hypothetical protein